jgi:hypothetical protein
MSFLALAWASKYRASSAAMKLVLLAFADRHNEETGCAYPSIAWLCEFSSLNRKTVIAAIDKLETVGVLADTGDRVGGTKQVKVYRLTMAKSAESGTVPKMEQSLNRNGSENGGKQSQKRDTDSVRNQASTKASPSPKPCATPADPFPRPEFADPAHWRDFLANRKRKRLPNTPSAHAKLLREIERFTDADWPPGRILQHAAEIGWAGIYDPRASENGNGKRGFNQGARSGREDPIFAARRAIGRDH